MAAKKEDLHRLVRDAVAGDYAISQDSIMQMRARSEKEIATLKMIFWISIGLFNLMVWDILPTKIPLELRWIVGIGSLFVALFFPIVGIRRHQRYLHLLSDCPRSLKRGKTDDAGRRYMERVKQQGRHFVRIEAEVLEGQTLED